MCHVDARVVVTAAARAYLTESDPDDTLATRLRRALLRNGVPLVDYPSVRAACRMVEAVDRAEEATVEDARSSAGGWWRDPDAVEAFLANLADEVVASCVAVSGR